MSELGKLPELAHCRPPPLKIHRKKTVIGSCAGNLHSATRAAALDRKHVCFLQLICAGK